jgi:hypothetical protein
MLLFTAAALAGTPAPKPQSVTIVDVPRERRDYGTNIGNIKVRFSDGRSEVWTSRGRCLHAHVSPNGVVGWTRYTTRNDHQEPVNNTLRIRFLDGSIKDFQVLRGPFIEEWSFADRDSAVVIKSRGRHGPAYYSKHSLRTGRVIDSVDVSTPYNRLPTWAQPFADDPPHA